MLKLNLHQNPMMEFQFSQTGLLLPQVLERQAKVLDDLHVRHCSLTHSVSPKQKKKIKEGASKKYIKPGPWSWRVITSNEKVATDLKFSLCKTEE